MSDLSSSTNPCNGWSLCVSLNKNKTNCWSQYTGLLTGSAPLAKLNLRNPNLRSKHEFHLNFSLNLRNQYDKTLPHHLVVTFQSPSLSLNYFMGLPGSREWHLVEIIKYIIMKHLSLKLTIPIRGIAVVQQTLSVWLSKVKSSTRTSSYSSELLASRLFFIIKWYSPSFKHLSSTWQSRTENTFMRVTTHPPIYLLSASFCIRKCME